MPTRRVRPDVTRAVTARKREEPRAAGPAGQNDLLARLPAHVRSRLDPHLETVQLERRQALFRAHEPLTAAYFPVTAVVSLVARLQTGETLEVGLVGREGLAGTAVCPGVTTVSCDGIVQVAGTAYRLSADILRRELMVDESLHEFIGRYVQLLLSRSMQLSVCNMFHTVEERCIRWLLSLSDITGSSSIRLTHELIATMLGVHRPTVSLVLGTLRRSGLILEERGQLVLQDRRRLELACCECYATMQHEQRRLLGY